MISMSFTLNIEFEAKGIRKISRQMPETDMVNIVFYLNCFIDQSLGKL